MVRSTRRRQHGGLFGFGKKTGSAVGSLPLVNNNLYTSLRLKFSNPSQYAFNPATGKIAQPLPSSEFLKWEGEIQQCAVLSRLAYSASGVLLNAITQGILEMNFEDADNLITKIEYEGHSTKGYNPLFTTTVFGNVTGAAGGQVDVGRFFPVTGCSFLVSAGTAINQKKTLYVIFKGSSSAKDFKSDFTITKADLGSLPGMSGLKGKVHKGFYNHMATELPQIIDAVKNYQGSVDRIVVCGHSLGGAMATLFSFIIANMGINSTAQPIECFTYGAPTMFSDDARNEFNKLLVSEKLLFNRVWATKDPITVVPPGLSHGGFKPLKLGNSGGVTVTGRSVDINDMRYVFTDIGVKPNINSEPLSYPEPNVSPFFKNRNVPPPEAYIPPNQLAAMKAANAEVSAGVAEEAADNPSGVSAEHASEAMVGGSLMGTLGLSSSGALYNEQTKNAYPTSIHYYCSKKIGFCHPGYYVGFMGALRAPLQKVPGSLVPTIVRRKEPTDYTVFKAAAPMASGVQAAIHLDGYMNTTNTTKENTFTRLNTPEEPLLNTPEAYWMPQYHMNGQSRGNLNLRNGKTPKFPKPVSGGRKVTHKKRRQVKRKRTHKRRA
jgi:hypothetical protein